MYNVVRVLTTVIVKPSRQNGYTCEIEIYIYSYEMVIEVLRYKRTIMTDIFVEKTHNLVK